MNQVQTVLGPVDADQLGFTLSHEHIVCGSPGVDVEVFGLRRHRL